MPTTSNGVEVPSFMYGTAWKKDATTQLVESAVESGFRAIDTANQLKHYDESAVGEALQKLKERGIGREALFLQTKFTYIGGQDHRLPYDPKANLTTQVRQSFESSLQHLHTDRLDSYVLHGPSRGRGLGEEDFETWSAIESLYKSGGTRVIGVSNVNAGQLSELISKADVKPMMVQNRCFAVTGWDKEIRDICKNHNIIYQGFSLLTANLQVLQDDFTQQIARRLNTGVAQVVFRFAMAVGMLPLTGTTNRQHMKDDLQSELLALSPDEVAELENRYLRR